MITIYLKQYNKIIRNADTKLFDELGYDDILWIDMLLPTIKEQKAVENFMEISLQTKQQVEEIESTSKYSENENSIISNSNFFVPTGDSFIVEPVSFIISNEGVLVSVRSAEFRTFRETEKRLQMNYRSYSTGYHLFISLLEVRIDFDADLVELIAKQVAALSKDINSENSIDKEVLHRISALQESTMSLRENIFDRQRVLSGILRSERFPNDIYPRLQLMIKDVNSLINHADFSFQRLDYIQDAALGLINIEQNEIVKIFLQENKVKVGELARAMGVTTETIRKDLIALEQEGLIRRSNGRAEVCNQFNEQPFSQKSQSAIAAKQAIAARAAEMIPPDATVFFDCGSTIYQLARLLILRKDLVAVTNSVHLAVMFASSGVRLITIGGEVRTASGAATGVLAVEAIHAINADLAFMGCSGFQNASGPCVENFPEAAVKKAMMQQAAASILLADSTKAGWPSMVKYAEWDAFTHIITDDQLPLSCARQLSSAADLIQVPV